MRPPHGHHRADFPLALADIQATAGGGNAFRHNREPAQIEEQTVIRLNRDTFYSFAVVDLAGGGRLAIPDPGDRYVSVMVVNEDHLNQRDLPRRRHLRAQHRAHQQPLRPGGRPHPGRPRRPDDIAAVGALQDQYLLDLASAEPFSMPEYDEVSLGETRDALLQLARGLDGLDQMFGSAEEIDPVRHLIGTAAGWGGSGCHPGKPEAVDRHGLAVAHPHDPDSGFSGSSCCSGARTSVVDATSNSSRSTPRSPNERQECPPSAPTSLALPTSTPWHT